MIYLFSWKELYSIMYYAVYLLNRTWNSNTGVSTPWELHTGEMLDLKQSPLVKYGTVTVFHQPLSLRTKKHPLRGEIGVFVGKNMLSPRSYDVYIPSRGTIVQRGGNYRMIDYVPESWKWKCNPRLAEVKPMSS